MQSMAVGGRAAGRGRTCAAREAVFRYRVLENFRQRFQRKHMEVEEVAGLLINGFLEAFLRNRISWHVADSSGRDVILRKGIDKSLADFGGICYLSGRWWPSRISEPMLEAPSSMQQVYLL